MSDEYYDESIKKIENEYVQYEDDLKFFDDNVLNDINNDTINIDSTIYAVNDILFKDKINMRISENFTPMSDNFIRLKYPALQAYDKIIYTNEDVSIDLIFQFEPYENLDTEIEFLRDDDLQLLLNANPLAELVAKDDIQINMDSYLYFFEVTMQSIDATFSSIVSFFLLDDTLVKCVFNFPEDQRENWHDIILQMLKSITKFDGGEFYK